MKLRKDRTMPLISVIIPVYNVADYLEKCLDSIVGQSYRNLEIILVDDDSTDESGAICEQYRAMDSRIKVIHQNNAGLASARNTGLGHATGDFLSFVDSDDYLDYMAYEKLLAFIENKVCDICYFGHYRVKNTEIVPYDIPPQKQVYCGKEEALGILFANAVVGKPGNGRCFTGLSAWSALYRRAFMEQNGLRFESERELLSEDIVFNMEACACAEHVLVYSEYLYYYVMRMQSLTKRYRADRFEAALRMDRKLRDNIEKHHIQETFDEVVWKAFCMNLIVCLKQEIRFEKKNGYRYVIGKIKYMGTHERTEEFLRDKNHGQGLQQKLLFGCLRGSLWHLVYIILKMKTY